MQFDIRRLDVYRKVPKDLTQPTFTGACVSIVSILVIIFLMTSELSSFMQTEVVSEMFVDIPSAEQKIAVRLNVTFPRLDCDFVGLDIQDDKGRHEVGFHENTHKISLSDGAGCRFEGLFYINRVPGNFHLSTHSADHQPENPDMSHVLNGLQFGDVIESNAAFNALKDFQMLEANGLSSHDYIIKVVPTIYQRLNGSTQNTFQYSYAHKDYFSYGHHATIMPAVWFRYDLSPITIKYIEKRKPFYHFITTFCAIIGGTFTVAGIVDGLIFTAHEVFKKAELGKLS
ncbi:endoplasmic reticulum-Golgi intermediate compartment protein 1-like [Hydractinia symbiolongicarpus]|uniref:endoplasmic reticulum-Golgi intermediate compartment protein 1-like n=1 Tax=Hydractinia symbiolongicarpus TaxID=13093 RepID=UPI00254F0901|nr:endoplasmic reticulum-Golgi intermediate compartment protein 1-like [Hydractinia symbiolongicarpus]XP_057298658.1 endoplasmic reticulum-Golgi intermediate compartment protein 1-like [Hydractinia symbiolongicarpus]